MEITEKVTSGVLGDHKAENKTYHDMLADHVQSCKARDIMSFNVHFSESQASSQKNSRQ
jgi:hypothetical protein